MSSEMIPDIRSLVCTNSLHLLHVPRQGVAKNMPLERMGGGNKPRWAVDGIWPAMAMAAPPPTMATRLPPALACSKNSLLCHPLIYSPRLLYLCHPNAQKNNVYTRQSYVTFYLAIWLVTTCMALFLLEAGTKKLFGSLASFSVHPFVSCFLFYFILVLSLLFSTYYFSSIFLLF